MSFTYLSPKLSLAMKFSLFAQNTKWWAFVVGCFLGFFVNFFKEMILQHKKDQCISTFKTQQDSQCKKTKML